MAGSTPVTRGRVLGLVVSALIAATPAACDLVEPPPSPSPTPLTSGIRGSVLIRARCPAPTSSSAACLEPYEARLVVLDVEGEVVGEAVSDAEGAFALLLPPGSYTITPVPGGDPFPTAPLASVSVVEGELTEVEIRYDSGTLDG